MAVSFRELENGLVDAERMQAPFRIFVYHHTHWDREWWAPMQDFRVRLVELMDELIAVLDTDAAFRSFFLDGQTIMLKDYLEVRPEQRENLGRLLRQERIQCGPWHVLPDQYLVSGEGHVRNLWLGRRTAGQLGARVAPIGYIPDAFGQTSQMPQILRGFGIDAAMIWRGRGGDAATCKQEFWWAAPDGSQVLTHWFPDGYYVFDIPQKAYSVTEPKARRIVAPWMERATTDCLLLPYGGDHLGLDRELPGLIERLNQDLADIGAFQWATPEEYFGAVRERAPRLERELGELRAFGLDYPYVLPGVLSARLELKQLNFHAQGALERYAEPFALLVARHGRRYDHGLIWTAWELLVQNHAHDSICGCSVDQVCRDMIFRFDQSRQIAGMLIAKSIRHINARIDTSDLADEELALVVHNPLPWARTELARMIAERPKAITAGTQPAVATLDEPEKIDPRTHLLLDESEQEIPFQVRVVDGPRPLSNRWRHTEVQFVADVPALGYRTYRLRPRATPIPAAQRLFTAIQPVARRSGAAQVGDLVVGGDTIENRFLRVRADPVDGSLRIVDKVTGLSYGGLNVFEDGGDAGDTYSYSTPLADTVLRSDRGARVHISVPEAGYASATLRVDLDWALPERLSDDRLSRAATYQPFRLSTSATLASESRRIEIRTEWNNRALDHRVRALFPLGAPVAVSHAEGQFDVVERRVGLADGGRGWDELPVTTMPQQGWCSVSDGSRGLTIANKGLPEFEALGDGTIALTLRRAVGWLSRQDLLDRTGGAAAPIPVPDAQSQGEQVVEYAIIPHGGGWLDAKSYIEAHSYLAPLYGAATNRHAGELPWRYGWLEVEGEHTLLLSACKQAERSEAAILRFWNVARQPTAATIRPRERPVAARLVNLAEEPLDGGAIEIQVDGSFELHAGPAQIVTVEIRFASGDQQA